MRQAVKSSRQPFNSIDDTVSATDPEALVYELTPDGATRLVGVEYIVPQEFVEDESGLQPQREWLPGHLKASRLHATARPADRAGPEVVRAAQSPPLVPRRPGTGSSLNVTLQSSQRATRSSRVSAVMSVGRGWQK